MKKIKKPMSGKGKLVMSLATAGMLTLGTLGTALADTSNQDAGQRRGVFGSVTAKGEKTLTLTVQGSETLVLTVNEQTKFQLPGKANPTLSDVAAGTRVAALVRRDGDGLIALKVMPMQGQPQREHRVLTVVDVNGRTVTAQDAQGNPITVELDHEISPDLRGQLATFIGEHPQQSNRFKANAEVKIEHIVERLERHTAQLQEEASTEPEEAVRVRKDHDAAQLMDRLEANRQRHLERLDQVIDRAPRDSRQALEQARERFEAQQAEARARFEAQQEQARARFKGHYEARLRALENPQGTPPDRSGAVRPRPDGADTNLGPRALQGVVQAVDASAGKLSILTNDGAVVTLNITGDATVMVGDGVVPLSKVTPGIRVTVHLNRDRSAVDEVQAKSEGWVVVMGKLKAVDAAAGTVTIVTREGGERTLKLSPSAQVRIQGAAMTSTDLKVGMEIVIKYNSARDEVIELVNGPLPAITPRPTTPLAAPASPGTEQELARARFHEAQATSLRLFQEQQTLALKRFHADQEQARIRFLEDQNLALARFQEQNKDEPARIRFLEDQKLALAGFQAQHAQALQRFQMDQQQAHVRFQEEQKLALARFLVQ